MRIEGEILSFLKDNEINSIGGFNYFFINHIKPESDIRMRQVNEEIRKEFQKLSGVYIYIDEFGNVLYVGIGKLADRVRFHYYESFGKYSGKNCEKHIKFFTQYPGRIKVLWTIVENREHQKQIEVILTQYLKPKYESMKKAGLLY
jgi:excinuclease UvrABC nuclease subunit